MSIDLEEMPVWESVRETLGQLSDRGDRFDDFAERHLDLLDELRLELESHERAVEDQEDEIERTRAELEREWQRLDALRQTAEQGAHQVQNEARRIAKLQNELQTARAEWERERSSIEGERATQVSIDAWAEERLAMQREITALREQTARLTELAAELVAARRELGIARGQTLRLQQRLAVARGHITPNLSTELRQLEQDRGRLSAELEQAKRAVASELSEQRERWLDEIGQLRDVVERRIARLESSDRGESSSSQLQGPIGVSDPVLDLVIAQFEQIEKDMQRGATGRSPPRSRK